ncbi:MAG: hypothetical protein H8E87_05830 [FCB group bacterium]|nr:hypothetical protein [FCB group bacterium]
MSRLGLILISITAGFCIASAADIYDRIAALTDSLKYWAANPPMIEYESPDSLTLEEFFPDCAFESVDSLDVLKITLPKYMDLLAASLLLEQSEGGGFQWRIPMTAADSGIIIDDTYISCDSAVSQNPLIIDHIAERLTMFRLMGLPPNLRSSVIPDDSVDIMVSVEGRYPAEIEFTLNAWYQTLSKIAYGKRIYAGLLCVENNEDRIKIKYYILITSPEAAGHHFLEWNENIEIADTKLILIDTRVTFISYIRTDNLYDLFAKPDNPEGKKVEIQIR